MIPFENAFLLFLGAARQRWRRPAAGGGRMLSQCRCNRELLNALVVAVVCVLAQGARVQVTIVSPQSGFVVENEFLHVEFEAGGAALADGAGGGADGADGGSEWRFCLTVSGVEALCGGYHPLYFLRLSIGACDGGGVCAGPSAVELGVSAYRGGAFVAASAGVSLLVPCEQRATACSQTWCRAFAPPRPTAMRHVMVAAACSAGMGPSPWGGAVRVAAGVHKVEWSRMRGAGDAPSADAPLDPADIKSGAPLDPADIQSGRVKSSVVADEAARLAAYAAAAVAHSPALPAAFGRALCAAARDLGVQRAVVEAHCGAVPHGGAVGETGSSTRVVHILVQPGVDGEGRRHSSVLCRRDGRTGHGVSCIFANLYYLRGRWVFYADGYNVLDSAALGWQCVDRVSGGTLAACPAPADIRLGTRSGARLDLWVQGDGLRHVFRSARRLGACLHPGDAECGVVSAEEELCHVLLARHEPETFGHAVMDGVIPAAQLLGMFGVRGSALTVLVDHAGPSPHDEVLRAVMGRSPVISGGELCGNAVCVLQSVVAGVGGLGESAESLEKAHAIVAVHARLLERLGGVCSGSGRDAAYAAGPRAPASHCGVVTPCTGDVIIVQRRESRRIANVAAIAEMVGSVYGAKAVIVHFEDHEFLQQVRLLQSGGIIISVWGSSIDNIAISAPVGAALLAVPVAQPMKQLSLLRTLSLVRDVYIVESHDGCLEAGPGCNVSLSAIRSAIEHAMGACRVSL